MLGVHTQHVNLRIVHTQHVNLSIVHTQHVNLSIVHNQHVNLSIQGTGFSLRSGMGIDRAVFTSVGHEKNEKMPTVHNLVEHLR
jgi:hypothetical protein